MPTIKDLGLVQSFTPSDKRVYTKVKAAGDREVQQLVAGKSDLGFDFEVFEQNGRIFELLLGTAQSVTTSTSESAAVISSLDVLRYKELTLSTGTADSETSVGKLQTFGVTFENTPTIVDSAGTIETQENIAGDSEITFEFTLMFEDLTEYDIFLGGSTPQTQPASKGLVVNANNGVTLGSGRREFEVQLAEIQYEEVGNPLSVGEVIISNFKGSATSLGTNKLFVVDTVTSANFF